MAEVQGENEGGFCISGLSGVSPSEFAQSKSAALRLQD